MTGDADVTTSTNLPMYDHSMMSGHPIGAPSKFTSGGDTHKSSLGVTLTSH